MVKQVKRKLTQATIVSMFFLIVVLAMSLVACGNGSTTNNPVNTPQTTPQTTPQPVIYNSPFWWSGDCDDTNYFPTMSVHSYDLLGYVGGKPNTWRGIEVCGPLPGLNSKGRLESFHGNGASQYEFQCTELIARYELAANGIASPVANGSQIVDAYTSLPNSPLHKVVNDGNTQSYPVEGDVLSYAPTAINSFGHTSIVTGSSIDSHGYGTINVIQQNLSWSGMAVPTETLTMTNWLIQPSSHGAGTVQSWMSTRQITPGQTPVPTPTQPPTPMPTPTPTPTQRTVPPMLVVNPTNLNPNLCQPIGDAYNCTVTIAEASDSQGELHWSASTNSGYQFNPAKGSLSPGQSTQITIGFDCGTYTLTYMGQNNTITGIWTCTPPTQPFIISPSNFSPQYTPNCTLVGTTWHCFVTLIANPNASGTIDWSVSSNEGGVQFTPQSGQLSPGQSMNVNIVVGCISASFIFMGANTSVYVVYTCY